MAHGDDDGLVLPPRLAPIQVAVVPIWKGSDPKGPIVEAAAAVRRRLIEAGLHVELDDRDHVNPGFKFHEWELLGVPLRLELGPRDLQQGSVMAVRRPDRKKTPLPLAELESRVRQELEAIQAGLLATARARHAAGTAVVDDYETFQARNERQRGFLLAHWCGEAACEEAIKNETKATIRCLAFDQPREAGRCVRCGGASERRAHFAQAY
jgi:prolyl-tRNA synthetase